MRVRARNTSGTSDWTQVSRLPAADWLNTAQSAGGASASGGASIASGGSIAAQLTAPTWGTITRSYDATHRSDRIDVNWTGDNNATGYSLVCAVAYGASPGWNWHPCGWVDAATGTVKFTAVPANATQPVGIVSYKRGSESSALAGDHPAGRHRRPQLCGFHPLGLGHAQRGQRMGGDREHQAAEPGTQQPHLDAHGRPDRAVVDAEPVDDRLRDRLRTYDSSQSPYSPSYTRCATLSNQDHSASQHSVTISTWTAGGTNYAIDNTSTYDIKICSTNTWNNACHLAPLISPTPR